MRVQVDRRHADGREHRGVARHAVISSAEAAANDRLGISEHVVGKAECGSDLRRTLLKPPRMWTMPLNGSPDPGMMRPMRYFGQASRGRIRRIIGEAVFVRLVQTHGLGWIPGLRVEVAFLVAVVVLRDRYTRNGYRSRWSTSGLNLQLSWTYHSMLVERYWPWPIGRLGADSVSKLPSRALAYGWPALFGLFVLLREVDRH